jgi:FK506-binding protein 1
MGVQKTIISEGNGPSPNKGDRVTMEYVAFRSFDCCVDERDKADKSFSIGTPAGCARLASLRRRASSSTPPRAAAHSRHPLVSDALSRVSRYSAEEGRRNKANTHAIGWDEGVVQMKLGEKARLDITSDFAYGDQEFPGLIPPHSDLILYVSQT